MISLILAVSPWINADPDLKTVETSVSEISAREMFGDEYGVIGVSLDFVIVEERRQTGLERAVEQQADVPLRQRVFQRPRMPQHVYRSDGRRLYTLGDWIALLDGESPYPRLGRPLGYPQSQSEGLRGYILPDGSIYDTSNGVPIIGGGEVVIVSNEGRVANPTSGEFSVWNSRTNRWSSSPVGGSQGSGISVAGCTLHILEGEELTQLEIPEEFTLGFDSWYKVKWADQSQVVVTIDNMSWKDDPVSAEGYRDHHNARTFIWRDGEREMLAKPAEFVTNIDGQRTAVTSWWAELVTPDGRYVGFTECRAAKTGTQSKFFVTVWDGDKVEILPIPEDIIGLARTGASALALPQSGADSPFEVLTAFRGSLSADAHGNIGLAPFRSVGDRFAFLWDGKGWHNVTKSLGMDEAPYMFQLVPESRKAFLYKRATVPSGPLWLVEY